VTHQLQAVKSKPTPQAAARGDAQRLAVPATDHERWMELQRGMGNQAASRVLQRRAKNGAVTAARSTGAGLILQRQCACGGTAEVSDTCADCSRRKLGLQTNLRVNKTGDAYEQEADRIAEQITREPAHPGISPALLRIQRISGQPASDPDTAPTSVERTLAGPGRPLDAILQQEMKQRFGYDFSQVRVHLGVAAEQSTREVHANAYTVGRDIVFGAGQFAPGSPDGRRLLVHELTHVVQQGGRGVTVQRQPKSKADQEREAALEKARAEGVFCTDAETDAQWDAEEALRLNRGKARDKNYAVSLGWKDKALIQKKHALSPKLLGEIATKTRFFSYEAKASYLQLVGNAVIDFGGSEAGMAILEPCAPERGSEGEEGAKSQGPTAPTWAPTKISCDRAKHEYEIEEEDVPLSSRCMDVTTDPERTKNFFDDNITGAVGFSVPATTWENVTYDRFKVMKVTYKNGKSEYFVLDDTGNFQSDTGAFKSGGPIHAKMDPSKYVKRRTTGLVYPVVRGNLYFINEYLTPHIISWKTGLEYQIKQLKDLYNLLQIGGTFASIMGLYAVGVESFKTSISAFQRTGPARLPGRPLPGIGVRKGSGSTTSGIGGEVVRGPVEEGAFKEEGNEGAFKGEPKGKTSGGAGEESGTDGKRTSNVEEQQSAGGRIPTAGGGSAEYRPLSKNPDIGVMEVRDDGSISIVTANRQDNLEPGVKVETHIRLANHTKGLGPSSGAARYRFYMQGGKVTNVQPLDRSPQTATRVGEIQRALQRNRLLSDNGTHINLDPNRQDDTLKKFVFPR
jgi:hypothetical protein